MDAKGLMIGDWLEVQDTPKYYKVFGIEEMSRGNACRLIHEDWIVDTWCDRVKPITLTEEILKANGFKCRQTYACPRYSWIDDKDHKLISFLRDREGYEMQVGGQRVRLLYVHQLQHALRICGLNELADNFVIEKGGNNG